MGKRRVGVKPEPLPHDMRLYKLLTQVALFYGRRFNEENRARQYLAQRGLRDEPTLKRFHAGYCDGTLPDVLPFDEQMSADLVTLGLVKENGKELFRECLTIPLWSVGGVCVGMYGRRLFDSEVRHLYLPGTRHGLANRQGLPAADDIILTESLIDAMSLHSAGVKNVLACYGTGGFTPDHRAALDQYKPKKVTVCFDGDESGERAARELADELVRELRGTTIETVAFPKDKDPNDILATDGVGALRKALAARTAHPFDAASATLPANEEPVPVADAPSPTREQTPGALTLHAENRIYEVKASMRQGTQLRATLKASKAGEGERFELATIDLYSHRSRDWFGGLCAELFQVDVKKTLADLSALIVRLESDVQPSNATREAPRIELTDTERDEAFVLLKKPTLLDDVLEAFEHVGYADEVTNKQLGYLVATSRKLERPLSLLIESRSSAGKSALQDAVLAFVPEEECLKYSRITDQALFYTGENALENKLLVLEEAAGMGGSAYSIRALQSGEALKVAATGKNPTTGKMRTEEYTVKARTAVMMTTTDPTFDEETKSRFIRATVNESSELTRRILEVQRHAETIEGIALRRRAERIKAVHRNAQRLLKSVVVANPFAPKLTFPATSIQARRDHKKYLGLIQTIALVYQAQRETKRKTIYGETVEYIEVDLKDIAIANRIAREVLIHGHGGVTPQARQLFGLIRAMVTSADTKTEQTPSFTRRRLREFAGWSDWQVRTHLAELVELEYLTVRQGAFGKEYVYALADTHLLEAVPGFGLTDPDAIGVALNGHAARPRRGGLNVVHA